MPFITEEIYSNLAQRDENDYIIIAEYPKADQFDVDLAEKAAFFEEVVTGIRNLRVSNKIPGKEQIEVSVKAKDERAYSEFESIIKKTALVKSLEFVSEQPDQVASFVAKADEVYVPVPEIQNVEEKRVELEKDLKRAQGLLMSVQKKLSNQKFVSNAPEAVIDKEKKKQSDSEAKIKAIEESLAALG